MEEKRIKKNLDAFSIQPNMIDYDETCKNFAWDSVGKEFEGLPSGGLNIAHEAIDRHANGSLAEKTALIWQGEHRDKRTFT